MKVIFNGIFIVIKWLNCWQGYLSFFIIAFIMVALNDNFLKILKTNEYDEEYLNKIQYVIFGYLLGMFLGYIHWQKFDSQLTDENSKKYRGLNAYLEKVKWDKFAYFSTLLIVVPLMGFILKWFYAFIFMLLVAVPLSFVGIKILFLDIF